MSTSWNNLDRLHKISEKEQALRVLKDKDVSKENLRRLVKTKCTTIMIGSLDSVEGKLGHLWGIDKDQSKLTPSERVFLAIWKELRSEILDKGNGQIKSMLNALRNYEVEMKFNEYVVTVEENYDNE